MAEQASAIAFTASVWVLPVLLAITLHEAAHGWVAWKLGDDTALRQGRVTFNPLRHVDGLGTVVVPALLLVARAPFLFGWAKPVPVAFARLRRPRRDMVLVAAAGPAVNLGLAVASAAALRLVPVLPETVDAWVARNLINSLQINVILAVFNLLPLPPLDGGRIAVGLLPAGPARALAGLERSGLFILLGVIFILPLLGRQVGVDLDVFAVLVGTPAGLLIDSILAAVGLR